MEQSSSTSWGRGSPTTARTAPSRRSSKRNELDDPVLSEIAEIVHDADLMDEKYGRPESEGLDVIVRGMQLALPDDEVLTSHTDALYDGLYTYLGREVL